MLKNYFTIAARTLIRNKAFTAITIVGLALSMSVCLLILAFIWDQKSYDDFHEDVDSVYRIISDRIDQDGSIDALAASPAPLGPAIMESVPGVEVISRIGQIRTQLEYEGKALATTGLHVEPSFFDLFKFETRSGDASTVIQDPRNLVVHEKAVQRYFGSTDPIGQVITLDGFGQFTVAGIIAETSGKSHLQFDVLAPYASIDRTSSAADMTDWQNSSRFATYLRVADRQTIDRLNTFLSDVSEEQYAALPVQLKFKVQSLSDISLGPVLGNEISSYSIPAIVVYFLGLLGIIIMLVASFNYVSLSVARSMRRAREIGVRKAMGAVRSQIFFQFVSEAILVALLSLVGAIATLLWLLPAFNRLWFASFANVQFDMSLLLNPLLLLTFLGFSLAVGVVAGTLPALRLSRFRPVQALKNNPSASLTGRKWFRSSLSGAQFAVALFFVTTTVFLYAQLQHLRDADYGFSPGQHYQCRFTGPVLRHIQRRDAP